ncbi:hypothetical protein [Clostridium fungisolvens]|uniref:Uncharacterized protein n=1 Tax=Clostridium fungisolvens TaxID=1604897 RepID=A0A6V8SFK8_9CLOT|nr:hypothetical protein [Clostridium fungisolvens]GFP75372.1 hypothetical protein bsdtw1_01449 [Clostridium fungisolvens]
MDKIAIDAVNMIKYSRGCTNLLKVCGGINIKKLYKNILLVVLLLCISVSFYFIQIFIFHDQRDTGFYLLQDLAFVPLQVIIVTVLIDQIVKTKEKQNNLKKISVVIGAFFTETGVKAISNMACFNSNFKEISEKLRIGNGWSDKDFQKIVKDFKETEIIIDSKSGDLNELKEFIFSNKQNILSMFENQTLLEHNSFTDMLWALYHIYDELSYREDLNNIPNEDLVHLSGDIKRCYKQMIVEWIYYMSHLKREYPFLYSLAVRKNPFTKQVVLNKN